MIIYTGGTIGMEKDYETNSLRAFDFNHIFNKIPEMNLLECEVSVHQFSEPLDSSDVGPEEWKEIAQLIEENYHLFDGFLILHGTDTMAYTASALSFSIGPCSRYTWALDFRPLAFSIALRSAPETATPCSFNVLACISAVR